MSKPIKLVPLELKEIDYFEAAELKHVQVFNNSLDNSAWENAEILYMGEHVCVYTSDSCKERTAKITDLMFRQNEAKAARELLRSQMPFNVSNMNINDIIKIIIQLGYRQIVKSK